MAASLSEPPPPRPRSHQALQQRLLFSTALCVVVAALLLSLSLLVAVEGAAVPVLYAGGNFGKAGSVYPIYLAAYGNAYGNSSTWGFLAPGVTGGNQFVYALAAYNGALVAGGAFTTLNGSAFNCIASWNGVAWSALGTGTNSFVYAFAANGTTLYAGGGFTSAGGLACGSVAQWNGTAWGCVGSGGPGPSVYALALYRNTVCAGSSGGLTCFNGTVWAGPGGGISGEARALALYQNYLAVGGIFPTVGGGTVAATSVALWNGTMWFPLGLGVAYPNYVFALVANGSTLYAGGTFLQAGGINMTYIGQWNGATWASVGGGVSGRVLALVMHNNALVAGGQFVYAANSTLTVNQVATWNGAAWSAMDGGMNGDVLSLASVTLAPTSYPYLKLSAYPSSACTGSVIQTEYLNTGMCYNYTTASELYTCNGTHALTIHCNNTACSVGCTTTVAAVGTCVPGSAAVYTCAAALPNPSTLVETVWSVGYFAANCTGSPSYASYAALGCASFNTTSSYLSCNATTQISSNCQSSGACGGNCTTSTTVLNQCVSSGNSASYIQYCNTTAGAPTTVAPTTAAPTTVVPTTAAPTTAAPGYAYVKLSGYATSDCTGNLTQTEYLSTGVCFNQSSTTSAYYGCNGTHILYTVCNGSTCSVSCNTTTLASGTCSSSIYAVYTCASALPNPSTLVETLWSFGYTLNNCTGSLTYAAYVSLGCLSFNTSSTYLSCNATAQISSNCPHGGPCGGANCTTSSTPLSVCQTSGTSASYIQYCNTTATTPTTVAPTTAVPTTAVPTTAAPTTTPSTAYLRLGLYGYTNCYGSEIQGEYLNTGVCYNYTTSSEVYACNGTHALTTHCNNTACSVGCTTTAVPVGTCVQGSSVVNTCASSLPAPGTLVNTVWQYGYMSSTNCSGTFSYAVYASLGCASFNTTSSYLSCNATAHMSSNCPNSGACTGANCTVSVSPLSVCQTYGSTSYILYCNTTAAAPTTVAPTTAAPTTVVPTTAAPTTAAPGYPYVKFSAYGLTTCTGNVMQTEYLPSGVCYNFTTSSASYACNGTHILYTECNGTTCSVGCNTTAISAGTCVSASGAVYTCASALPNPSTLVDTLWAFGYTLNNCTGSLTYAAYASLGCLSFNMSSTYLSCNATAQISSDCPHSGTCGGANCTTSSTPLSVCQSSGNSGSYIQYCNTTAVAPTTVAPTTVAPTTVAPTTVAPTTVAPTTAAPTTAAPTAAPTTAPTTAAPTTATPTTAPTTAAPTTATPSTVAPTTAAPTTATPTTVAPTTASPTTSSPTTSSPTTSSPTTSSPTSTTTAGPPSCAPAQYGASCLPCSSCANGGVCYAGIDGNCTCSAGWTGATCAACAAGYYGTTCQSCTLCVHGNCTSGVDGSCACDVGWSGADCNTCAGCAQPADDAASAQAVAIGVSLGLIFGVAALLAVAALLLMRRRRLQRRSTLQQKYSSSLHLYPAASGPPKDISGPTAAPTAPMGWTFAPSTATNDADAAPASNGWEDTPPTAMSEGGWGANIAPSAVPSATLASRASVAPRASVVPRTSVAPRAAAPTTSVDAMATAVPRASVVPMSSAVPRASAAPPAPAPAPALPPPLYFGPPPPMFSPTNAAVVPTPPANVPPPPVLSTPVAGMMPPPPPPRLPSKPAWLPPVSAPVTLPPPQPPTAPHPPRNVAAWLATAGLSHLQATLIDNGYDALDVVAEMHDKDMNACGIYNMGDRAALTLAIQRLRSSRPS